MLRAAGLLAKKAVELGLKVKPHIKTSLAPGSRIVTEYLEKAGLLPYLEKLGFAVAGLLSGAIMALVACTYSIVRE